MRTAPALPVPSLDLFEPSVIGPDPPIDLNLRNDRLKGQLDLAHIAQQITMHLASSQVQVSDLP